MIKRWFTLIELLIVIIILSILLLSLLPKALWIQSRARDVQRKVDMQNISTALMIYYTDHHTYPIGSCNASLEYIMTVNPWICKWNYPWSTTWFVEYSLFSWFLTELDQEYLKSIPKDPQHPNKTYAYSFDPNINSADNIYIKSICNTSYWSVATLGYAPEKRRRDDIVRSCPDNTPRDYISSGSPKTVNRYNFMRTMLIYDDKYAPLGDKKVPGECFDDKKNPQCL